MLVCLGFSSSFNRCINSLHATLDMVQWAISISYSTCNSPADSRRGRTLRRTPYLQPINKEAIKFTIYGNESGAERARITVDKIDFSGGSATRWVRWRDGENARRVKFTQAHRTRAVKLCERRRMRTNILYESTRLRPVFHIVRSAAL